MRDESGVTESRIEALETRLAALERRVAELAELPRRTTAAAGETAAPARESRPDQASLGVSALPLIGRVLLALAGAFLLRAITEAAILPQEMGTALGILYAVVWIVFADRSVARGARTSATFHGVAGAVIAFPLLWEATVRFGFLSATTSAAALGAVTLLGLGVAWRRGFRRLAWVFALGAAATAWALLVATQKPVLFSSVLLLLGIATLWLGYVHGWRGPGWLAAASLDLALALTSLMVLIAEGDRVKEIVHPASVVALLLTTMIAYLGSFAARVLTRCRNLVPAEILQGVIVVGLGLGGAAAVVSNKALPGIDVGAVSLLLAVGCYGASFAFIDRLQLKTNFISFTTLGLLATVIALGELLEGTALVLALAAAALGTTWLGAARERSTLCLHGSVYAAAAALASGLALGSARALFGAPSGSAWIGGSSLTVLAVIVACSAFASVTHGRTWSRQFSRTPRFVHLVLLVVGLSGLVVSAVAPWLDQGSGSTPDAGELASLRTGVLSAAALGLAAIGRWRRFVEASWLVYPLLVAGGLKLLLEDLRAGRPATLVASLALYGGALIVAPRMIRRQSRSE